MGKLSELLSFIAGKYAALIVAIQASKVAQRWLLVAYIGGINFSADHLGDFGPEAKQDYAVRVRGPVVAQLRDSQAYVMLVGLGRSLFDYHSQQVREHQDDWAPLLKWVKKG